MKKGITMALIAMTAGVASASILYEDFTANPSTDVGTANVSNATIGVWYDTTAANYNGTDGTFRLVRPGNDGGVASLLYVVDGSALASGQEYAVNIDFSYGNNTSARLGLDIWDVDYGTGSVTAQVFRWWGGGDLADLSLTGDATANELVDFANWAGDPAGKLVSTNFTYDGSGDILLRISGYRSDAQWFRSDVSSVEVVAVPEPATIGLMASFGLCMVYVRRRLQQ